MEYKIKLSQFVDYFEYQEACGALTRNAMTSVKVVTDTATPGLDLPQKAFFTIILSPTFGDSLLTSMTHGLAKSLAHFEWIR